MEINNPNFVLAWSVSRMSVSRTSASRNTHEIELAVRNMRQLLLLLLFGWLNLLKKQNDAWYCMMYEWYLSGNRQSKTLSPARSNRSFWRFVMLGWSLPSFGPLSGKLFPGPERFALLPATPHESRRSTAKASPCDLRGCSWLIYTGNIHDQIDHGIEIPQDRLAKMEPMFWSTSCWNSMFWDSPIWEVLLLKLSYQPSPASQLPAQLPCVPCLHRTGFSNNGSSTVGFFKFSRSADLIQRWWAVAIFSLTFARIYVT